MNHHLSLLSRGAKGERPVRSAVLNCGLPAVSSGSISGVKAAIARVNPDISIESQTLASKVDDSIERETLLATLSGFFGVLTLLLVTIGLYGVMSYNVARRRNEIGIRLALGAEQSRVLRMVLNEVVILIAIGLIAGIGMALATTRMVAGFSLWSCAQ